MYSNCYNDCFPYITTTSCTAGYLPSCDLLDYIGPHMQRRASFLDREVAAGQRRMWEIKGRIKAAYKTNRPRFHQVRNAETTAPLVRPRYEYAIV